MLIPSAADPGGDGSDTPGITVATYTVRPDSAVTIPVVRQLTSCLVQRLRDELRQHL